MVDLTAVHDDATPQVQEDEGDARINHVVRVGWKQILVRNRADGIEFRFRISFSAIRDFPRPSGYRGPQISARLTAALNEIMLS